MLFQHSLLVIIVAIDFPGGKCNLKMNLRAQFKILMGKPIITPRTSSKRKENIINIS